MKIRRRFGREVELSADEIDEIISIYQDMDGMDWMTSCQVIIYRYGFKLALSALGYELIDENGNLI
ncbi:hypothetical protein HOO54_17820 [Bacillus sp. WMMC1349]|uniref:hypothetical protein n=1 Tax=Bacillus sp. WMMC1349 TaxID=2736254 RepID=UPI001552EB38|nr:hypothetical protein [Bacillus sp. WMMC1349]NPC94024.1 hypothetical protein [Bacillus sp. WMMC1349]